MSALDRRGAVASGGASASYDAVAAGGTRNASVSWAEQVRGWATPEECAAVEQESAAFICETIGTGDAAPGPLPVTRRLTSSDRAADRWGSEARAPDKPRSEAMEELMRLRGLEVVKGMALSLYTQVTPITTFELTLAPRLCPCPHV